MLCFCFPALSQVNDTQGVWLERSWERPCFQDQIDGQLPAILIIDYQGRQVVLFIERDDRQKGVTRQRENLGDIDAPVTVAVFLPDVVVPLVMVLVFDAPMLAHRPPETLRLVGRRTRDEAAGVLVLVFRAGFFHPLAPDLGGTVRR